MIRFLPLFLLACAPTVEEPVADTGVELRRLGVVERTGIDCVRMGRCPEGQSCKFDRTEDGGRSAPYCVDDVTGVRTDDPPQAPWWPRWPRVEAN